MQKRPAFNSPVLSRPWPYIDSKRESSELARQADVAETASQRIAEISFNGTMMIASGAVAGTETGTTFIVSGNFSGTPTFVLTDPAGNKFALAGAKLVAGATPTDYDSTHGKHHGRRYWRASEPAAADVRSKRAADRLMALDIVSYDLITVQGDGITADLLIWRRYRSVTPGMVEAMLEANPEITYAHRESPFLPVGLQVRIPIDLDLLSNRPKPVKVITVVGKI